MNKEPVDYIGIIDNEVTPEQAKAYTEMYAQLREFAKTQNIQILLSVDEHKERPVGLFTSKVWCNLDRVPTRADANDKFEGKVLALTKHGVWEETSYKNAGNRNYYTHWMKLPWVYGDYRENEQTKQKYAFREERRP